MRKIFAVLAFIMSIFLLTSCGVSSHSHNGAPSSLIGSWYQTNSKSTGVKMTASITSGRIHIDLVSGDTSSIYWVGTFNTRKNPSDSFKATSRGDTGAMELSLFGSQDKTKDFSYKRGDLSYKFTMMGNTSTIHLAKKQILKKTSKPTVYIPGGKTSTYSPRTPKRIVPAAKPVKISPPKVKTKY